MQRRHEELENRKRELDELAGRIDQAHARIAEADEREAVLKAVGQALLERYGGGAPRTD